MTDNAQQNVKKGLFPVDECFGTDIGRPLSELVEGNGIGRDSREELVSFEEFVRGADKKRRKTEEKDEGLDLRPIDGDGLNADDFFDIALTARTVPEDPMSPTDRMPNGGKGGRSELYEARDHISVAFGKDDNKCGHLDNRQREWGAMFTNAHTAKLRQSLCPTVGDGAGWLSGGRTRRESQDSTAYGYEPPEEPFPMAKMPKTEDSSSRRGDGDVLSRGPSSLRRSLKGAQQRQRDNDGTKPTEQLHNRSQMVQSNSLGDLVLSKFLCCFRALNPTQMGGRERKCCGGGGGTAQKMGQPQDKQRQQQPQQKCYSWDKRDDGVPPNSADFCFTNAAGKTLVKEPGQLNGQPFQIENCKDSLILLMDRTASITVDDSRNCVILAGPCQGSIFLRDCTNILILAVCQQFRTRDCRQLVAHLFCATSPTIEETDMTIGPLLLNYSELLTQMNSAGLSPFANRWSQVHNFTPESGKCQLSHYRGAFPTATAQNFALIESLNDFLAHSPLVNQWELCIGNPRNSQLFAEEQSAEGDASEKERVLVLLQQVEGSGSVLRFYVESVDLARGLLGLKNARLVAMHDIDLRMGEWDTLLGENKQHKKQKMHTTTGKMITLEIEGLEVAKHAASFVHSVPKTSFVSAKLVEGERMKQYTKQLYRFCEVRQSI